VAGKELGEALFLDTDYDRRLKRDQVRYAYALAREEPGFAADPAGLDNLQHELVSVRRGYRLFQLSFGNHGEVSRRISYRVHMLAALVAARDREREQGLEGGWRDDLEQVRLSQDSREIRLGTTSHETGVTYGTAWSQTMSVSYDHDRPRGEEMATENLRAELQKDPAVEVLMPSDKGYDEARAVWNGTIDLRPAAVARCGSPQGVAHAIRVAVERALPLAVRGGGHSLPGFSTCEGGIVIDLSPMRAVEVDVDARIARAGGGCRWSDFDAATAAHGLASTGGVVSSTGVAGLTLGGGIGWLMNQHGLACDNLIGAQLVTADGKVIETSDPAHAGLLWGLRGGGGNFGTVTRLDFRVSPVAKVVGGAAFYHPDRIEEVGHAYRDMVASLSDAFTTMLVLGPAPDDEFVPPEMRGALCAAVVGCSIADPADADAELELVHKLDPAVYLFDTMPYSVMQSLFDTEFPAGGRYYFKGGFLSTFSDGAMEVVIEHMRTRPSAASEFDLHHMGGAVHRVSEMDTAFSNRSANFTYNIIAKWQDQADDGTNRDWVRSLAAALEPYGEGRGFVNFLSEESDAHSVRAAYGAERYERLVELKRRYDPHNAFRLNQNVRP